LPSGPVWAEIRLLQGVETATFVSGHRGQAAAPKTTVKHTHLHIDRVEKLRRNGNKKVKSAFDEQI